MVDLCKGDGDVEHGIKMRQCLLNFPLSHAKQPCSGPLMRREVRVSVNHGARRSCRPSLHQHSTASQREEPQESWIKTQRIYLCVPVFLGNEIYVVTLSLKIPFQLIYMSEQPYKNFMKFTNYILCSRRSTWLFILRIKTIFLCHFTKRLNNIQPPTSQTLFEIRVSLCIWRKKHIIRISTSHKGTE